jgi:preprotein translocase subunit SecB
MAEQDSGTPGNGSDPTATGAEFSVLAQYIKDLSVENPNAPAVYQWQNQPSLDVQFSLNAQKLADDVHEVAIKVEVTAKSDNGVHFVVDLTYAGLFGARNIPEDSLGPVLLVEAPRLLFPFARQIVSEAVVHTGFPPLLLEPIDFASAYVAQAEQLGQQSGGAFGTAPQGNEPQ